MKIVIDIDDDLYTRLFDNGIQDNEIAVDDICEMARALRRGTPLNDVLNKIRDEIAAIYPDDYPCNMRIPERIRDMAVEIVEKYIGENE